jgi:polyhydroxyalkanoate synthesis regulator phasin
MKTTEKLNTLLAAFNDAIKLTAPDKVISELFGCIKRMTSDFVGQVVSRKRELKAESFDAIEALRQQIKALEEELFS